LNAVYCSEVSGETEHYLSPLVATFPHFLLRQSLVLRALCLKASVTGKRVHSQNQRCTFYLNPGFITFFDTCEVLFSRLLQVLEKSKCTLFAKPRSSIWFNLLSERIKCLSARAAHMRMKTQCSMTYFSCAPCSLQSLALKQP